MRDAGRGQNEGAKAELQSERGRAVDRLTWHGDAFAQCSLPLPLTALGVFYHHDSLFPAKVVFGFPVDAVMQATAVPSSVIKAFNWFRLFVVARHSVGRRMGSIDGFHLSYVAVTLANDDDPVRKQYTAVRNLTRLLRWRARFRSMQSGVFEEKTSNKLGWDES